MSKTKTPTDEKFEKIDFDLFEALVALDKKDYGYYDRLTEEQQKKFVPFMMIKYLSALKGRTDLQQFHVLSTNEFANKYFLSENIHKHPKLQWLMLCSASLGAGKQFHPWIPQIKESVSKLKDKAVAKDIKEYYKKVYPKADDDTLDEFSKYYTLQQHKKVYLAEKFPSLKLDDIAVLAEFVSDEDIKKYEQEHGNY
jgi:hypothetical protein